jgi:hypothetical protein
MSLINVPVSAGELLDKITILRIKQERIADPAKLENVNRELRLLEAISAPMLKGRDDCAPLVDQLFAVNAGLWDIEDGKRDCERRKDFGERFVQLARSVYLENDRRAAIKRRINELLGSDIVEEKSYQAY